MRTFDPTSPRITAYDIHEWIQQVLRISEYTVSMIQIDGIKRQVFIKLIDDAYIHALLRETNGQAEYKHHNGVLSIVNIAIDGMGTKRVRIAKLPPEVKEQAVRSARNPIWSGTGCDRRNVAKDVYTGSAKICIHNLTKENSTLCSRLL